MNDNFLRPPKVQNCSSRCFRTELSVLSSQPRLIFVHAPMVGSLLQTIRKNWKHQDHYSVERSGRKVIQIPRLPKFPNGFLTTSLHKFYQNIDIKKPPKCPPSYPSHPKRQNVVASLFSPVILIISGGLVSLAMSAALGANDVANSLGTAVGTGAINVSSALLIGAIMEFAGAVLFGGTVTKTIASDVLAISASTLTLSTNYMLGMLAVLIGCTSWLGIATKFGLPVSSTHSVVGALVGLGFAAGWRIRYDVVYRIVSSWFLSPVIGAFCSLVMFKVVSTTVLNAHRPVDTAQRFLPLLIGVVTFILSLSVFGKGFRFAKFMPTRVIYLGLAFSLCCSCLTGSFVTISYLKRRTVQSSHDYLLNSWDQRDLVEHIFKKLQVITACLMAFSHGSNDVSNAIGPFAAMYSVWTGGDQLNGMVPIPLWVLILGGCGISGGLCFFGKPVMETVGQKITKLKPTMGFCVEFSTASTVLIASRLGLPVSTTHTLIGCIVALGLFNGDKSSVNKATVLTIAGSWGLTLPFSAFVTALFYLALKPFLPICPTLY